MRILLFCCLFSLLSVSYAGEVIQTDWSGGSGVLGPVAYWGDQFYTSLDAECFIWPGKLCLGCYPVENIVSDEVNRAWCVKETDVNNDGLPDLIAAARDQGLIYCFINLDGTGENWVKGTFGPASGVETVCCDDFDGDGNIDVAAAANASGEILVFLNVNGGGAYWQRVVAGQGFTTANSVHSGDMDGDGDADVIGSAYELGRILWWENLDGSGTQWQMHTVATNYFYVLSAYCTDIDGDGDTDVLGSCEGGINIALWENLDGTGTSWSRQDIATGAENSNEVRSADIDGDGDNDIIGAMTWLHKIQWWENSDGTGSNWIEHDVCEYLHKPYTVHVGDVDQDGNNDIIAGSRSGERVVWYDNISGDGSCWDEHIVDPDASGGVSSVDLADINEDGFGDILVGEIDTHKVAWWDLTCFESTGYVTSSILNMQEEPQWLAVDWNGTEPPGTETVFQFRTGKNPLNMGVWTEYIYRPCDLCHIVADGDTLFQYRVRFFTDDSLVTPSLDDFLVSWDPLGTGEETLLNLLRIDGGNPVTTGESIAFTIQLESSSNVALEVFDLSGRMLGRCNGFLYEGAHEIAVEPVPTGVYFAILKTDSFCSSIRFAAVERNR